jgi:hypothetical protein
MAAHLARLQAGEPPEQIVEIVRGHIFLPPGAGLIASYRGLISYLEPSWRAPQKLPTN